MLEALQRRVEQPATAERDEQLAVQTCDFVDLLRIHVRKEEAVVFRVAERVLEPADLREVAIRMKRGATARSRRVRGNPKGKPS